MRPCQKIPSHSLLRYRPSRARAGDLIDAIRSSGFTIIDLATTEADLEQAFLRLTRSGPATADGI